MAQTKSRRGACISPNRYQPEACGSCPNANKSTYCVRLYNPFQSCTFWIMVLCNSSQALFHFFSYTQTDIVLGSDFFFPRNVVFQFSGRISSNSCWFWRETVRPYMHFWNQWTQVIVKWTVCLYLIVIVSDFK